MAYTPPLNGGRINATISGNTAGAGSLVSTGTLTLAGGNNITLSQAGNAITISGGAAGGNNTFGMSNIGNTSGTSGVVSGSAINYLLAGGNNITLSQSLNGASGTLSISAASQTNQTLGLYALGNTTQGTFGTLDARSVSFNGLGGVSVGYSNGFNFSAPQTSMFSGTGAISISTNGSTISIGAPAMFDAGISNIGNTSGVSGLNSNGLVLAGGNNVTLSQSTNSVGATITVSAASQTNQTLGIYATGNTTQSTFGTVDARNVSFNGLGNVSVGYSNGSVQISGGAGGVAVANSQTTYTSGTAVLNPSAGAISIVSRTDTLSRQYYDFSVPGQSSLSATGALSISNNGSTVNIGVPAFSIGVASNSTVSNQFILTAGNNITLSQSTNSAGATVTISGGAGGASPTMSGWEYPSAFQALSTISQSALSLQHIYVPFNVVGSAVRIGGNLTVGTFTSATTASVNMSLLMGIYSINGSTLSALSTGSALNAFSWGSGAAAANPIGGIRQLTVPMNISMTPGEYWIGALINSASTMNSGGATLTLYGNNLAPGPTGYLSPIGAASSAVTQWIFFGQGIHTATTLASMPTTIPIVSIRAQGGYQQQAAFYHNIYNATY